MAPTRLAHASAPRKSTGCAGRFGSLAQACANTGPQRAMDKLGPTRGRTARTAQPTCGPMDTKARVATDAAKQVMHVDTDATRGQLACVQVRPQPDRHVDRTGVGAAIDLAGVWRSRYWPRQGPSQARQAIFSGRTGSGSHSGSAALQARSAAGPSVQRSPWAGRENAVVHGFAVDKLCAHSGQPRSARPKGEVVQNRPVRAHNLSLGENRGQRHEIVGKVAVMRVIHSLLLFSCRGYIKKKNRTTPWFAAPGQAQTPMDASRRTASSRVACCLAKHSLTMRGSPVLPAAPWAP